jgi:hypothetical protein
MKENKIEKIISIFAAIVFVIALGYIILSKL